MRRHDAAPVTAELLRKTFREGFEKRGIKLDDTTQLYIEREVQHVMKTTYDIQYPDWSARKLFPINSEVHPGARNYVYFQYDKRGIAKIVSNYAKDFPRIGINKKSVTGNLRRLGASYGYSIDDILSAEMAGMPLEAREAQAAKEAILQKENQIAFAGDTENDLPGFLTNSNITNSTILADGTGNSKTFALKSASQIIRDITLLARDIVRLTKGVEKPDTLLLPPDQYTLLATTPAGVLPGAVSGELVSSKTILAWLRENVQEFFKDIFMVPELAGAGVATPGADVMVAYRRDPMKLALVTPQDFIQYAPQLEGMEWTVPCSSKTGGVMIPYPLSIAKGEGI